MNLTINVSLSELESALLETAVEWDDAVRLIKLLDEDIMQDWDFTEAMAKHFVLQMKQLNGDTHYDEVWSEFEAWLKEELK